MLRTIEKIARVGVFNDADGTGFPLERLTLIYAGNGHGKSTLGAVLSAAGNGDDNAILERQALGSSQPALIKLQTDSHSLVHAQGNWRGQSLKTTVFDTGFVDRNLHTGGQVSPSHRAELLAFAIGEAAVAQETILKTAEENLSAAKDALDQNEAEILASAHGIDRTCTVDSFAKVSASPDVAEKIAQAEEALTDGRNSARILVQALPNELSEAALLSEDFFKVLSESLTGVHGEARKRVAAHVQHLDEHGTGGSAEAWLSQGTKLSDEVNCPFCGQDLQGIELVDMYADFFNEAYDELRLRVDAQEAILGTTAREARRQALTASWQQAEDALTSWRTHVELASLPGLDSLEMRLSELGTWVDIHLTAKKERLEVAIDVSADKERGQALEEAALAPIAAVNEVIRAARSKIEAYKDTLTNSSIAELEADLIAMRLQEHRGTQEVVDLFAARKRIEGEIKGYQIECRDARAAIKKAMDSTLAEFEQSINKHLDAQHAGFTVENVKATFVGGGGTSRGNYALNLRGHSIDVSRGEPPFRLALSEGDKRTLAFAFFCAVVLSEQDLRGRIVVVDDPVTSLDKHRRTHAINTLNDMSRRGAQVIVLAHDANLLKDVRDRFAKSGPDDHGEDRPCVELQLKRPNGHSYFASIDLDIECATPYFRHHQTLMHFMDGEDFDGRPVTRTDAGKAIRPLIEAYLRGRFPGDLIPKDKRMLGSIIGCIRTSRPPHPLAYAIPLVSELDELNDFATRYHHDSGSDGGQVEPDEHEVRAFAARALRVVHGAT